MNADQTVDWLVQEVNDLLDVSSVGLYEFMEFLNDPDHPLPVDERQQVAERALDRILAHGGVELHWMRWPKRDSLATVPAGQLPPDPWRGFDEDGRYLALERVDDDRA